MIRKLSWLVVCGALAGAGCGDDDGGTPDSGGGGADGGDGVSCPSGAPMREQMMGECCYRIANDGERANAPEFRLAALDLQSPESVSGLLIAGLLRSGLDEETFNWIMKLEITDSTVAVTTGYGQRNPADNSFSFAMGSAPGPEPADRWDPITVPGTISGDVVTTEPVMEPFTVPVFDPDGMMVTTEFPLHQLELTMATLSAERSCVGARQGNVYTTDSGSLQAFITVEDAKVTPVMAGPIDTSLCMLLINMQSDPGTCDDIPRAEWPVPPDSLCDASGCTTGGCDPASDCNAWLVTSGFAAQAVEIN